MRKGKGEREGEEGGQSELAVHGNGRELREFARGRLRVREMRHVARDDYSREMGQVLRYTVVGTILICGVGFGDAVLRSSPPPPGRLLAPPSSPAALPSPPRHRTPKSTTLVLP